MHPTTSRRRPRLTAGSLELEDICPAVQVLAAVRLLHCLGVRPISCSLWRCCLLYDGVQLTQSGHLN